MKAFNTFLSNMIILTKFLMSSLINYFILFSCINTVIMLLINIENNIHTSIIIIFLNYFLFTFIVNCMFVMTYSNLKYGERITLRNTYKMLQDDDGTFIYTSFINSVKLLFFYVVFFPLGIYKSIIYSRTLIYSVYDKEVNDKYKASKSDMSWYILMLMSLKLIFVLLFLMSLVIFMYRLNFLTIIVFYINICCMIFVYLLSNVSMAYVNTYIDKDKEIV